MSQYESARSRNVAARKITLAEAAAGGAVGLIVSCASAPVSGPGCRHGGQADLFALRIQFGDGARLDALPFRCSACGSAQVDVRPWFGEVGPGGLALD
jgi:hypothetical protein